MDNILTFYKKNFERLKSLASDCPECIKNKEMCRHYDYLKDYIKELEEMPPFDSEKFNHFWKEYPRKMAKKSAEKIWLKMKVDDELFEKIITALEEQKKSKQWIQNKGQYVPHPTTWLNGERWNDDVINYEEPKKPFYNDSPMKEIYGKWKVFTRGEWFEFAGKESEIVWK